MRPTLTAQPPSSRPSGPHEPGWSGLRRWGRALLAGLMALIGAQAMAATRVHFEIDMREEISAGRFDPAKDRLGIRGAAPLSWDTPLYAHPMPPGERRPGAEAQTDNTPWTADLLVERAPINGALLYKFRIERTGQGANDGWEPGPDRSLELVADQVLVARAFGAPAAPISISRAGRIEALPPLGNAQVPPRGVQVWLPPGYEQQPDRRYPVLYLQDGQTVFDAAAAGAEWGVDETAQRLVVSGQIQPLIIVGVASGPQRVEDYTATRIDRDGLPQGGKAAAYAGFLIGTVKPEIDKRYRTLADAAHTAVGGATLAGNLSLWLALHRDDVFGAALVVSPTLEWDNMFPIRDVVRTPLALSQPRPKLWLDTGTNEGQAAIKQLRQLRGTLLNRGWNRNDLNYLEAQGGKADEASWAARVAPMLLFLDRSVWPGKNTPTLPKGSDDPFPPTMPSTIHPQRTW